MIFSLKFNKIILIASDSDSIAICTRSRHFSRLHFPTKTLCFCDRFEAASLLFETESKAQKGEGPLRDLLKTICPQGEAGRRFGQDHAPYDNESKVGFLLGHPRNHSRCKMSKVTTNGMKTRPCSICSLIGLKLKTQASEWKFSHYFSSAIGFAPLIECDQRRQLEVISTIVRTALVESDKDMAKASSTMSNIPPIAGSTSKCLSQTVTCHRAKASHTVATGRIGH